MNNTVDKNVRVIEATKSMKGVPQIQRKRVCAYCRISTDSEIQRENYINQVNHYTRRFENISEWDFVDIYVDETTSGMNTNRTEFNRMITNARNGKLDLILVKSVSVFSRSTKDLLPCVRELKTLGVAVLFERENINTMDAASDVFLAILCSLAQDEYSYKQRECL
jgi:site-specific DNA recombinase